MADWETKQNDTRPLMIAQLIDDDGAIINLTAATSVKMIARSRGSSGAPKINAACTFFNRPTGEVLYTWVSADTSSAGNFDFEFEITWNDGGTETIPRGNTYFDLLIGDDLG